MLCYFCAMSERVGVRELRQNLSVYLRRVRAGERLTVTEHNVPVAELVPLHADDDPFARLVAEGRIVPARRSLRDLPPAVEVTGGAAETSRVLDEIRDDRI